MTFQTGLVKLLHMSEGSEYGLMETYMSTHDRQTDSLREDAQHIVLGRPLHPHRELEDKPGALIFLSTVFRNL